MAGNIIANMIRLWQIRPMIDRIPTENWQIAFSADLQHPDHLRFSARGADGKPVTVYRQCATRMLEDIVIDESDLYGLIIGNEVFDSDSLSQSGISSLYDGLRARLQPAITQFLTEQRLLARQQSEQLL